jgi:plastocyanin
MHRFTRILATLLTLLIAGHAAAQPATQPADSGVVRGRVTVKGASLFQKPDLTRVVVFLASSPALDAKPAPSNPAIIAQRNKTFTPNFVVVRLGTTVEFPNWDDFDHNVFSRSAAAPAFDLSRYPKGQSKSRVFEKLGVVQIFCNIHPDMRAIVYVTPNDCFTRADKDGNFEIDRIPPGNYEIVAWQERCEEIRQPISVAADHPLELNLSLSESRDRVLSEDRRGGYGWVERGLGVKREQLDLPVVTEVHTAPPQSRP